MRLAGVPSADLDARVLAQHALGFDAMALAMAENVPANNEQSRRLEALVERRLSGEPVARILGEWAFYGLEIGLAPSTLVPRPETELVVDLALGQIAVDRPVRLLDLGTGSGAIVIALLAQRANATAVAIDISGDALAMARANAERHGVAERLELRQGSWFTPIGEDERFAVIASNPPYIESAAIAGLRPEVREHDPLAALDGGPDGLDAYRAIVTGARQHLLPGGSLIMEIGFDQADAVEDLLREAGFADVRVEKDLAGLDRVAIAHHL